MKQLKKTLLMLLSLTILVISFISCNKKTISTTESQGESNILSEDSNNLQVDESKQNSKDEEVLNAFRTYYESIGIKYDMTDDQIAELAKSLKTSDNISIYDKGINVRFDNYNGKGIRYGSNQNYVGNWDISGFNYKSSNIKITDPAAKINYPLNIKPGDSLRSVFELLEIVDEYEYMIGDNTIPYDKKFLYGDKDEFLSYNLYSDFVEPIDTTIDNGWLTLYYKKIIYNENGDKLEETISLNFVRGILTYISIYCTKQIKGEDVYDPYKPVTFYFDNSKYYYNEKSGVYTKIKEISSYSNEITIKYISYSDNVKLVKAQLSTAKDDLLGHREIMEIELSEIEKEYEFKYIITDPRLQKYCKINFSVGGNCFTFSFSESLISYNEI